MPRPTATTLALVTAFALVTVLPAGNVTAGTVDKQVVCADLKSDAPSAVLLLPVFEVDTSTPGALTTLFAVHNQTDDPLMARIQYFDRTAARENAFTALCESGFRDLL